MYTKDGFIWLNDREIDHYSSLMAIQRGYESEITALHTDDQEDAGLWLRRDRLANEPGYPDVWNTYRKFCAVRRVPWSCNGYHTDYVDEEFPVISDEHAQKLIDAMICMTTFNAHKEV